MSGNIKILPKNVGVGFCSKEEISIPNKYRHEQCGIWHNYFFTKEDFLWPKFQKETPKYRIDGFSPNLNKQLHVGHLRNLVLASSLQKIIPNSEFMVWFGGTLGINEEALANFQKWCNLAQYAPDIVTIDVIYAKHNKVQTPFSDGVGTSDGCKTFKDVIVRRSDGTPTYAYYELLLHESFKPDFCITGVEQTEHFKNLGFENVHLPMGLVLGEDGKKMKSRTGESLSAVEAFEEIKSNLNETPEPDKLAWNIAAWNFLKVSRKKNVQFNPKLWSKIESGGMNISYTYARINKALGEDVVVSPSIEDLSEDDIKLLGVSEYFHHYQNLVLDTLDPVTLAIYGDELASMLGSLYHKERIKDGRVGFRFAIAAALYSLSKVMDCLTMYKLLSV